MLPIEMAGRTMHNEVIRKALLSGQTAIKSGREIGKALEETQQYPPAVVQIFAVGQQSGKLEEILDRLADMYATSACQADGRPEKYA